MDLLVISTKSTSTSFTMDGLAMAIVKNLIVVQFFTHHKDGDHNGNHDDGVLMNRSIQISFNPWIYLRLQTAS